MAGPSWLKRVNSVGSTVTFVGYRGNKPTVNPQSGSQDDYLNEGPKRRLLPIVETFAVNHRDAGSYLGGFVYQLTRVRRNVVISTRQVPILVVLNQQLAETFITHHASSLLARVPAITGGD